MPKSTVVTSVPPSRPLRAREHEYRGDDKPYLSAPYPRKNWFQVASAVDRVYVSTTAPRTNGVRVGGGA